MLDLEVRVLDLDNGQRKTRFESTLNERMECVIFFQDLSDLNPCLPFLHLYHQCFIWANIIVPVVSRSGNHGRQPVVLFVCWLVCQEDTLVDI